jgi:hypothetical protein
MTGKPMPPKNDTFTARSVGSGRTQTVSALGSLWAIVPSMTNGIAARRSVGENVPLVKKSKSTDWRCPRRSASAVPP